MDGGIDWFTLALTAPLVPMLAIVGALFWLRTARPRADEAVGVLNIHFDASTPQGRAVPLSAAMPTLATLGPEPDRPAMGRLG